VHHEGLALKFLLLFQPRERDILLVFSSSNSSIRVNSVYKYKKSFSFPVWYNLCTVKTPFTSGTPYAPS